MESFTKMLPEMNHRVIRTLGFFVLVFLNAPAQGASYDCSANNTAIEAMICKDANLSKKDSDMAAIYKELLGRELLAETRKGLTLSQRDWLKKRNACKVVSCLNDIYDERIDYLSTSALTPVKVAVTPPVCADTFISKIAYRLEGEDAASSGSSVTYQNGLYGVSYDYVPAISKRSKVNDPVKVCLISKYANCPKNDERGKTYRTTNLRTLETWELDDSSHMCGGA